MAVASVTEVCECISFGQVSKYPYKNSPMLFAANGPSLMAQELWSWPNGLECDGDPAPPFTSHWLGTDA